MFVRVDIPTKLQSTTSIQSHSNRWLIFVRTKHPVVSLLCRIKLRSVTYVTKTDLHVHVLVLIICRVHVIVTKLTKSGVSIEDPSICFRTKSIKLLRPTRDGSSWGKLDGRNSRIAFIRVPREIGDNWPDLYGSSIIPAGIMPFDITHEKNVIFWAEITIFFFFVVCGGSVHGLRFISSCSGRAHFSVDCSSRLDLIDHLGDHKSRIKPPEFIFGSCTLLWWFTRGSISCRLTKCHCLDKDRKSPIVPSVNATDNWLTWHVAGYLASACGDSHERDGHQVNWTLPETSRRAKVQKNTEIHDWNFSQTEERSSKSATIRNEWNCTLNRGDGAGESQVLQTARQPMSRRLAEAVGKTCRHQQLFTFSGSNPIVSASLRCVSCA